MEREKSGGLHPPYTAGMKNEAGGLKTLPYSIDVPRNDK
jgi:hypothetical protein